MTDSLEVKTKIILSFVYSIIIIIIMIVIFKLGKTISMQILPLSTSENKNSIVYTKRRFFVVMFVWYEL